jgi:hypothetical protein
MFELHVVVAAVIMSNILELLMEIMPNYPTMSLFGAHPGFLVGKQFMTT